MKDWIEALVVIVFISVMAFSCSKCSIEQERTIVIRECISKNAPENCSKLFK